MTLGNQILMFQERNVKCFYINTPRLTKDQRVSICLEYPRVNNAREVIPATLGRSLSTNVYFLTSGEASPTIWSCYANFKSLSLFISLEIDCFHGL